MAINILRFVIPKSLVEFIDTESTVRQAIEKMLYHRYTAIPVLDVEGKYVGVLRNDDVLRYFLNSENASIYDAEEHPVTEFMDTSAKPLLHSTSMNELVDGVKEHNFLPVIDDRGCFIGIVLRRDVMNFLLKYYDPERRV